MLDLGNSSVCEECAMICTDVYSDDKHEDIVVYRDQGISSRKYNEDTYGELMETDSNFVNYNVALCTQDSVSMEKKRRQSNRDIPSEEVNTLSPNYGEINDIDLEEALNSEIETVQDPSRYNEEIESQKTRTMRMPTTNSDISMTTADEQVWITENNKKFLYARAMHADHMIQYHMQEILERQREIDEYKTMANDGQETIPLVSEQHKNDPVVCQHIMRMIDTDILWYEKTFREVVMKLQTCGNDETTTQISEEHSEDELHWYNRGHATFDDQRLYKSEEAHQDGDYMECTSVSSEAWKSRPRKCFPDDENYSEDHVMMCWENLDESERHEKRRKTIDGVEETNNNIDNQDDEMDDEKHPKHTVHMGNRLNIPVEELKLGGHDDTLTLATQETSAKNLVYITNIHEGKFDSKKHA